MASCLRCISNPRSGAQSGKVSCSDCCTDRRTDCCTDCCTVCCRCSLEYAPELFLHLHNCTGWHDHGGTVYHSGGTAQRIALVSLALPNSYWQDCTFSSSRTAAITLPCIMLAIAVMLHAYCIFVFPGKEHLTFPGIPARENQVAQVQMSTCPCLYVLHVCVCTRVLALLLSLARSR